MTSLNFQRGKRLLIRDEVHGDMTFDPLLERVIDHESVQRLRFIKQLGLAEYIFPCATHTRFQHSLGASYLAGRYFQNFTEQWLSNPPHVEEHEEKTSFYTAKTFECIKAVVKCDSSRKYWYQVASLGGLLHDVGHGPWSHTFEHLPFQQDFSKAISQLPEVLRRYFRDLENSNAKLMHEDISALYIFSIMQDLEREKRIQSATLYALPVILLVHRKLARGKFRNALEDALAEGLDAHGIKGSVSFYHLLSPIVSGPFDVDRMDYIQRDGRNCGVSIGAIEWRRIVNKLIPCLAKHPGTGKEADDVVLFSSVKNQHVLDDFVFSLFQMYTQVYLHPKIVGLEEILKSSLQRKVGKMRDFRVTLETHQKLTDEKLRNLLSETFGVEEIESLLTRKHEIDFEVLNYPSDSKLNKRLVDNGFKLIEPLDRAMMKESLGVFLYSKFRPLDTAKELIHHLSPWAAISPVARHFYQVSYSPSFWLRTHRA